MKTTFLKTRLFINRAKNQIRIQRMRRYQAAGPRNFVPIYGMLVLTVVFTALGLAGMWKAPEPVVQPVQPVQPVTEVVLEPEETEKAVQTAPDPLEYDDTYMVEVLTDAGAISMRLDAYLTGVVAAEMPASFELEALKAQATAARTFTLKQIKSGKHDGAICADSACCQAYLDETARKERFGAEAEQLQQKIQAAVEQTDGMVITYDDTLIDAVYFSCSGGQTEDAAAVWGNTRPYLVSVQSPGEEAAPHDTDLTTVALDTFCQTLQKAAPDIDLSGNPVGWFGSQTETPGGGVATMQIGGQSFTGTQLRQLFSLRSTMFTVAVTADAIEFQTHGYGHRVGMSQYGANAMAEGGADFQASLTHYYTGTEIKALL